MTDNQASYITHLESALDAALLPAGVVQTMHNDRPLWVRYDLAALRENVKRDALADRNAGMWRYRELLPVESDQHIVSLGETMTPVLKCNRLGQQFAVPHEEAPVICSPSDERRSSRHPYIQVLRREAAPALAPCKLR